eukprot:TRINITY_DN6683_c0_g1_i6.p1 TRINITY_DN6683_c0_g1~~TRINITY_DN6683_c0_g1_i6.p1  ORF type:complete len:427 (+),score=73.81 TRINITY_DN6683_c0_g1_i6:30-1310(+)
MQRATFFFSSRRRHTRQESVSWARRCVQETASASYENGLSCNGLIGGKVMDMNGSSPRRVSSDDFTRQKKNDISNGSSYEQTMKIRRNRESAKNSRRRKKLYIELLEKKVTALSEEIEENTRLLEADHKYLDDLYSNNRVMNSTVVYKTGLINRLQKIASSTAGDEEISALVESLSQRLGTTGQERISAINYFFKQLIEVLLPVHLKHLLWASSKGKINENPTEDKALWSRVFHELNLTPEQAIEMIIYKERLQKEQTALQGCIQQILERKSDLEQHLCSLQKIFDEVKQYLSPRQNAILLSSLPKDEGMQNCLRSEDLWGLQRFQKRKENGQTCFSENLDLLNYFGTLEGLKKEDVEESEKSQCINEFPFEESEEVDINEALLDNLAHIRNNSSSHSEESEDFDHEPGSNSTKKFCSYPMMRSPF